MNYMELNAAVSGAEQAEILTAMLADYPFEGFLTEDTTLRAYIPEAKLADCKAAVDAMLNSYGVMRRTYLTIEACDWNAEWERHFEPVEVDGRLRIRAPFHAPAPEGMTDVIVSPRMAFGTGHHATTYLMLSTLLELDVRDRHGLDVGSGTGVLAIAAVKAGAASVDALDTDEWAEANCRQNAGANGVEDRVHTLRGSVESVSGGEYGFVLANINRNVLTAQMPHYAALLAPGGDLLLSGFLVQDESLVAGAVQAAGLTAAGRREKDGWVVLHAVKA